MVTRPVRLLLRFSAFPDFRQHEDEEIPLGVEQKIRGEIPGRVTDFGTPQLATEELLTLRAEEGEQSLQLLVKER